MKSFKLFSNFFSLKHNILKCEVAAIDSLKGLKMAVCGNKSNKTRSPFSHRNEAIYNLRTIDTGRVVLGFLL